MITIRPAAERGNINMGWLDTHHSFSFGHYYDPEHMGFGPLRVINEDYVKPAAGFDTHGHSDMEIITYVLEGALAHKDSLGNGSVIRPGNVQRMSAGRGIRHSEFNHSAREGVHLLQIWIMPNVAGIEPGYEEKTFSDAEKHNTLRLVASGEGRDGSVLIHQNADVFVALLDEGAAVTHRPAAGRKVWIQIARGGAEVNGVALAAGDGAAIERETTLTVTGRAAGSEILLFDLPN